MTSALRIVGLNAKIIYTTDGPLRFLQGVGGGQMYTKQNPTPSKKYKASYEKAIIWNKLKKKTRAAIWISQKSENSQLSVHRRLRSSKNITAKRCYSFFVLFETPSAQWDASNYFLSILKIPFLWWLKLAENLRKTSITKSLRVPVQ